MKIERNVDLRIYNTYGVGGEAKYFVLAEEQQDLIDSFSFAREKNVSIVILGGGSNVLISDKGLEGLVVINRARELEVKRDHIQASSGISMAKVVKVASEHGLSGLEFMSGIPGTLGGAVFGNAGAWGKAIGSVVESVDFLDENGVRCISGGDLRFGYRTSIFKELSGVILGVTLRLKKAPIKKVEDNTKEILSKRRGKSPVGRSCGSFFKNIETKDLEPELLDKIGEWLVGSKVPVGRFIEEAGCKGMKVGSAEVSKLHANYIINTGSATADDIKKLAEQVQKKVFEKFGVELEPEVRYL